MIRRTVTRLAALLLAVGSTAPGAASAQSLDERIGRAVYEADGTAMRRWLGAIDRTALPIAFGAGPVWGAYRLMEGDGAYGDSWRATLSVAGGLGVSVLVKHLVARERPFRAEGARPAKSGFVGTRHLDRYAFPSGHSAMSAALVTSLALDHPRWYVIVPGALWAGSVGLSRVWLGVHHPSDVVVGWAVGVAVAWTVHAVRETITPDGWDVGAPSSPVLVRMRW